MIEIKLKILFRNLRCMSGKNTLFSAPVSNQPDPLESLSKGFGSALSFGSSFVQKAASVAKENAVKIGGAAAHAGSTISAKAQDGSLASQSTDALGNALGTLGSWGKAGWSMASKATSDGINVINKVSLLFI